MATRRVHHHVKRRTRALPMPTVDWTPFWLAAAACLMTFGHYLLYGYW